MDGRGDIETAGILCGGTRGSSQCYEGINPDHSIRHDVDAANSVDGYSSIGGTPGTTPRATPRRDHQPPKYDEDRSSVEGYTTSIGGTPSQGTPRMKSVDGEGPRKSPFFSRGLGGVVGGKKTGRLIHEDGLQVNAYHEDVLATRFSMSPQRVSFPVAGPVQAPESDLMLAFDVEAARYAANACSAVMDDEQYVMVEVDKGKLRGGCDPPMRMFLKFLDVRYKVVLRQQTKCGNGEEDKEILHGITGSVAPGEMLAMMGPSGSGKTTLLNLLGGRGKSSNLTGEITYNDLPFSKNMKRRMGFVTQDDVLYPHLTVKETLTYAALLRLPKSLTQKEKMERAENVIGELGLERCRDTLIGGTFLRGVSGGERKRVCIGHEILIDPSVILLDEPTSGLDSTTALRIIQLMQNIAQGGRTVVTTIHQPSSRLFHMFDKLLLLAEGHSVYFGKAMDAMNYFSSIGFSPLITMNPADFLLDLCSGNTNDVSVPQILELHALQHKELEQCARKANGGQIMPATKDVRQYLVERCEREIASRERVRMREYSGVQEELKVGMAEKRMWTATWRQQFTVLFARGLKERRHEYLSWLRVLQVAVTALLSGCLWWQSKAQTLEQLQDQSGLLFFIAIFWGFFPLFTAIFTFPLERAVLAKERSSDMYRLSAYFMARSLGDLPLDLILPALFICIVYFMTNLRMSAAAFSFTMLTVFLTVIASQGVGLLIGAALMDVKQATTLGSVLVVAFMLAGGFFVQDIPPFIAWLKYLSLQSYGYKLLVKIQYGPDTMGNCSRFGGRCPSEAAIRKALHGIELGRGGEDVVAMLIMVLGYRVLAYVALRRMKASQ